MICLCLSQGELITPAASAGALKGITRDTVLTIADELGVPWREANLTRYDIWVCDELFLTGTAAEIIPIVEVDARPIGDAKPGRLPPVLSQAKIRRTARLFSLIFINPLWLIVIGTVAAILIKNVY